MLKNLVTVLAVIGFVSTTMAQGRPVRPVDTKAKERIENLTPEQRRAQQARDNQTGARVAEQAREASKAGLKLEEINSVLAKIENAGVREKVEEAIKKHSDKVTNDETFLADVVLNLMKEVNSNPSIKEQQQIVKFIEESFTLMSISGKSGKSARQAMATLARELGRGTQLDSAVRTAMKEAFPELSEAELNAKIEEFKKACLGKV